ncbi:MAG: nuclear transport factor 2 family protein [Caulobacter sp.]|nr:nuclear transport factor 2 family protein [Caulobacter sp.]
MNDTPEAATAANRAATRRYVDAWLAGDFPAMMATYADGFIVHWFGDNPFAKTYQGKAEAIPALMAFTQRTGRRLVDIVDVTAGPARAVVIVREAITVGGVEHEVERALVYRVEAGLLAECWVYDQDQRLIDAALSS